MPTILASGVMIIAAYFSTFIYCLIRNFINARSIELPSIIVPWDQNHFLWMVTSVPLRPFLQTYLPKSIYDRLVLTIYGWEFHEKLRPFKEYSAPQGNEKSFLLVSCGRLELWTWDAEIVAQILGRPRDFMQVDLTDLFMAKFGHNVLTSNGDKWARQRKVVASTINERISKSVFDESASQTLGLLHEITSKSGGNGETNQLFNMAKKITIHVLGGAGMGASVPWDSDASERPKPGFQQTYIQSVKTVIESITGAILLPQWFLQNYPSFFPGYQRMKSVSYAVEEFPVHTLEMLEAERKRMIAAGNPASRSNIMSQLLQASEQSQDSGSKSASGAKTKALSDEEMMGNLFVFTAAGFDTTANTVSYALVLLARHPKWQDWLLEELDQVLPANEHEQLDYAAIFPKATRLLAFMFETLRLFTPLIHISKQTRTAQTITTSRGTYRFPANTTTYIDTVALHLDPEIWGNRNLAAGEQEAVDDAQHFRPSRWLNPPGSPQTHFQPAKGSYVPWSAGPRVCPGQKMAQVEFVAIFLTLLRQHRIEAVPLAGESRVAVEKRLDARMKNSISILTLQMNDVYDVLEKDERGLMMRLKAR